MIRIFLCGTRGFAASMTLPFFCVSFLFCEIIFCAGSPVISETGITHRFIKSGWGSGAISIINKTGGVEWTRKSPDETSDCCYLPDGGIAYSFSNRAKGKAGMVRLDPAGKELWIYNVPAGRDNHSCWPLKGGGFLMGHSARNGAWMVEVDKEGKLVKEVPVAIDWGSRKPDLHHTFRQVRKTPEGHYLAAAFSLGRTYEWNKNGKLVRVFPKGAYVAMRLPNGNTLCSAHQNRTGSWPLVVEFNREGKITWKLGEKDVPFPVSMVCGIQRLPNGNTVISNVPHGRNSKLVRNGPQLFEVTPAKKVVWQFRDWKQKNMGSFQIIDTNGIRLKPGEIHR